MSPNAEQDFSENYDSDAILRVASRDNRRWMVLEKNPEKHDPVRSSLFKPLGPPDSSSLGCFRFLPQELISYICLELDATSALKFSHTTRGTRELIANVPQYRRLGEHGVECLWALYHTGLAPHTSISVLDSVLLTERCVVCGSFGCFVFLPTMARCCWHCIRFAPDFQVVPLERLTEACGLPRDWLQGSPPAFRAVPESLPWDEWIPRTGKYLISVQQATALLGADAVGNFRRLRWVFPDALPTMRRKYALRILARRACVMLPYVNAATGDSQRGIYCKGCRKFYRTQKRYESGLIKYRTRLYTRQGFLDHFRDCPEAKEFWLSRKDGRPVVVDESE